MRWPVQIVQNHLRLSHPATHQEGGAAAYAIVATHPLLGQLLLLKQRPVLELLLPELLRALLLEIALLLLLQHALQLYELLLLKVLMSQLTDLFRYNRGLERAAGLAVTLVANHGTDCSALPEPTNSPNADFGVWKNGENGENGGKWGDGEIAGMAHRMWVVEGCGGAWLRKMGQKGEENGRKMGDGRKYPFFTVPFPQISRGRRSRQQSLWKSQRTALTDGKTGIVAIHRHSPPRRPARMGGKKIALRGGGG